MNDDDIFQTNPKLEFLGEVIHHLDEAAAVAARLEEALAEAISVYAEFFGHQMQASWAYQKLDPEDDGNAMGLQEIHQAVLESFDPFKLVGAEDASTADTKTISQLIEERREFGVFCAINHV